MPKKVGKYEIGETLGEGEFGKVKYAIDTETNKAVAIKFLDKEKIRERNMGDQIKKEISIMRMVKHKNIVNLIDVFTTQAKIFIVCEIVSGGELFTKFDDKLSEEQSRFYFRQLMESVEYCHDLGFCHRLLTPEIMLLDENGNLKVNVQSSLYAIGDVEGQLANGTPSYVPPEALNGRVYDGKKADVWSCGVLLYILLAGYLPFDESTIAALFAKILSADFTHPSWFSPEVRSLIDQMLVADPNGRITVANIKNHPWYTSGLDTDTGITTAEPSIPNGSTMKKTFSPDESECINEKHESQTIGPSTNDNQTPT